MLLGTKCPTVVPEVCKGGSVDGVWWAWEPMGYDSREGSMVLFTVGCMRQETKGGILERRGAESGV